MSMVENERLAHESDVRFERMFATLDKLRQDLGRKPSRRDRFQLALIWASGTSVIFVLGVIFGASVFGGGQ